MTSLRFQSVFDIIGPVMIGPSSSHTAGAVRIGKIVYSIFNDEPTEVEFQLFNSFAKTYRGHGTDLALVAGILGMDTDDPEIPNSLEIAHKRGIKVVWSIQKDSKCYWGIYWRGQYSSNRAEWFFSFPQHEHTYYYYCSSRCPWYDCSRYRGPLTLQYQHCSNECHA